MRHRRRQNTQTLRRKTPTTTTRSPVKQSSGIFRKIIKTISYLILIIAFGYAIYEYGLPLILETGTAPASRDSAMEVDNPPKLPVEEITEPESEQQTDTFVRSIQLEVLNGCGEQGLAKILTGRLRKLDYDVVNSGNYLENGKPNFEVAVSRIIDQLDTEENRERCAALAGIMGINPQQVESFANPNPIADISIVVGKDFKDLVIFQEDADSGN